MILLNEIIKKLIVSVSNMFLKPIARNSCFFQVILLDIHYDNSNS
jgi:hypothetical protein